MESQTSRDMGYGVVKAVKVPGFDVVAFYAGDHRAVFYSYDGDGGGPGWDTI